MLPLQFFSENIHFAISLFATLVFFAVFWLYFDAWAAQPHKNYKDSVKWAGFLLISLSFLLHATVIEQSDLGKPLFGDISQMISTVLRLVGYAAIIVGQVIDPLQEKPKTKTIEEELATEATNSDKSTKMPALSVNSSFGLVFGLPLAAISIAGLYWRRATIGLEHHLKPVAIAFFILFWFELFSLADLLRGTANPTLFDWVKAFGPLWIFSHLLLLASVLVLGRWVWHYLVERFISQLFMIFTSFILTIFLFTTVSFTFLLMGNIQNDALSNLETAGNVLGYALAAKKAETRANADAIAANPLVVQAISVKDHKGLTNLTSDFLASKKQSSLVITSDSAQVLLRAEDPDRWADSLSSDTLIRRALTGTTASGVVTKEAVLAPLIYLKTAVPVREVVTKQIIGTATVSLTVDNALVDGIKNATGLDSAIYSGNVLSATTFVSPGGKSRLVGVKSNNKQISETVLKKGKTFKGTLNILNRPFLAVYQPLKDADNSVIGMLFIGQPQSNILRTAGHSIELTFIIASILLILSIIPAYLIARFISKQLE